MARRGVRRDAVRDLRGERAGRASSGLGVGSRIAHSSAWAPGLEERRQAACATAVAGGARDGRRPTPCVC